MMNNNTQPDRIFRPAITHHLPEGDWRPLPTKTHHSASAFLLSLGESRILLAGNRQAHYRVKEATPSMLLEDAPMNRFEVGYNQNGSLYLCSALSQVEKVTLTEREIGLLYPHAGSNGGLRFLLIQYPEGNNSPRGALMNGVISLSALGIDPDEIKCQYERSAQRVCSVQRGDKVKVEVREGYLAAMWVSDKGFPYALVEPFSSREQPQDIALTSKRRVLSYTHLGKSIQPIRIWYAEGKIHALLVIDRQLVALRESSERGGNADKAILSNRVWGVSASVTPQGQITAAWQERDRIIFAHGSSSELIDNNLEKRDYSSSSDRLDVVLDDHDRPHLLMLSKSGPSDKIRYSLRTWSWLSGQKEQILGGEGEVWGALSQDRNGITRGMALVGKEQAQLLLPVNQAQPQEPDMKIEKDA
jgi:hypothetical protein